MLMHLYRIVFIHPDRLANTKKYYNKQQQRDDESEEEEKKQHQRVLLNRKSYAKKIYD